MHTSNHCQVINWIISLELSTSLFLLAIWMWEMEAPMSNRMAVNLPGRQQHGTSNGNDNDVVDILKNHHSNWIRLRLFVDPSTENGYPKQGYCGLEKNLEMAK
ncbi:glycosyl hydrolase 53 family protein [Cyclobacterium sp.]|uniref:glycosyl hydrolase 53 family protein n=1 Tax=Cyclobacterium sp. TaxID=1966343 RepID=UPI0019BB179B|nr:glycosyl hydrolase 53 family protein [Cyclobacterium sp.]MBD3629130.1 glycosyl hydrolase 53 family protein [Cyclobacterium sp.]